MLEEVSKRMVKFLEEKSTNGTAVLQYQEVCMRYTLDNVAACVFGVEGRSFDEEYSIFRKLADDFFSPGSWQSLKALLAFEVSFLSKVLNVK